MPVVVTAARRPAATAVTGSSTARRRPRRALRRRTRDLLVPPRRHLPDGRVALTFDDGPSDHTAAVLEVLAAHGVAATFFLVGRNAVRRPWLARRIVDDGHAIASHSLTHPDPRGMAVHALWRDYRDGRRAVEHVVGRAVPLFRPPTGHLGLRGALAARAAGAETWLWSRDAADWEPDLRAQDVAARLLPIEPGDVLLLHDGLERPWVPRARDRSAMVVGLDALLTRAVAQGVAFTTLDATGTGRPHGAARRGRP